jgi:hypothetical protein
MLLHHLRALSATGHLEGVSIPAGDIQEHYPAWEPGTVVLLYTYCCWEFCWNSTSGGCVLSWEGAYAGSHPGPPALSLLEGGTPAFWREEVGGLLPVWPGDIGKVTHFW